MPLYRWVVLLACSLFTGLAQCGWLVSSNTPSPTDTQQQTPTSNQQMWVASADP